MKQNLTNTGTAPQKERKCGSLKELLYDYFRSSSNPLGKIGRFNLRMMNLFHTPMARWNLSLIPFNITCY